MSALLQVTKNVVYLEEGDVVEVGLRGYRIFDAQGEAVERPVHVSELNNDSVELGEYRHYMQKEIHEQPQALANTLESVCNSQSLIPGIFGAEAAATFADIESILILACGTSNHAGQVARYWLEEIAGIPCTVEVASEYRYRVSVANPKTLVVTISQSGETADTLAALNHAKAIGHLHTLAICNVPESAHDPPVQAALADARRAGNRRGLDQGIHHATGRAVPADAGAGQTARQAERGTQNSSILHDLRHLPSAVQAVLNLEPEIAELAETICRQTPCPVSRARPALPDRAGRRAQAQGNFLHPCRSLSGGRTEAWPAGAGGQGHAGHRGRAQRHLLEKLKSNLQEVRARGGELYVFADADTHIQ